MPTAAALCSGGCAFSQLRAPREDTSLWSCAALLATWPNHGQRRSNARPADRRSVLYHPCASLRNVTGSEGSHYWPPLPPGCPTEGAASAEGVFFRLVRGTGDDWRTHAMIRGANSYPAAVGSCRWHALSVFSALEDAQRLRRKVPMFRDASIAAFQMAPEMGVSLQDKPPSTHYDWWPASSFRPPPGHEIVRDADSG
jgi:hypothetical protein